MTIHCNGYSTNCTQNHKIPEECLRSDCALKKPFRSISKSIPNYWVCNCGRKLNYYESCIYCMKNRMSPDETFIQWLKIIGLTIALGVMGYQTWLLYLIYKK